MTSTPGPSGTPATPPAGPPGPTCLTARAPEDLLAVVPVVLGFVPTESVVMLTFGAGEPFHARVDLPGAPSQVPDVVASLCRPAHLHRVRRVVFVLYATRASWATRVLKALLDTFESVGIEVIDALRADGRRWYPLLRGRTGAGAAGVAYDVSAHPFVAQAVLEGRVTLASRAELAGTLAPDPDRVARLAAAVASLPDPRPAHDRAAWARELVRAHAAARRVAADPELARLLLAVRDEGPRDAVWTLMTRVGAHDHVGFWTDVVRRAPDELLPTPAALLGFAAWLAGHGALAWCALDRCFAVDPEHWLGSRVGEALTRAVAPSSW